MLIIDRFEGEFAVCEDGGESRLIPRAQLPADAAEGDVLSIVDEGYVVDQAATHARRAAMRSRFAALLGRMRE